MATKPYYVAQINPFLDPPRVSVYSAECLDLPTTIRVPNNTPDGRGFRLLANASDGIGAVPRDRFASRCVADTREGALALLTAQCEQVVEATERKLATARAHLAAVQALASTPPG